MTAATNELVVRFLKGEGPSKYDFQTSLFFAPRGERISVFFGLGGEAEGITVELTIESAQREDGSGESFNFTAHFVQYKGPRAHFNGPRLTPYQQDVVLRLQAHQNVHGYYSTRRRSGTLTLSPRS